MDIWLLGLGAGLSGFAYAVFAAARAACADPGSRHRGRVKGVSLEDTLFLGSGVAAGGFLATAMAICAKLPAWKSGPGTALLIASTLAALTVIPQILGIRNPASSLLAGATIFSRYLFRKAAKGLLAISDRLNPWRHRSREPQGLTEGEMQTLVLMAHEDGALMRGETEMIREILKLARENARHCMTPRIDLFSISDDMPLQAVVDTVRAKRRRYVPVIGETPDDVLGILDVRNFLMDPAGPFIETLLPPSFVPETMSALELLRNFLTRRQHLALLVDEFGGVSGVVTLSDLLEEIMVGTIPASDELYIEELGDGRLLVSGAARLDDLERYLGPEPDEGVETIGGLLLKRMGQLPKHGESIDFNGWRVTVRRVTRKQIKELTLSRIDQPGEVFP